MNKRNLSRATVKIIRCKPIKPDTLVIDNISMWKAEMKNLGPNPTTHPEFKKVRRELKNWRQRLKQYKTQNMVMRIFLKKYNEHYDIEGEFDHSDKNTRRAFERMINDAIDTAIRNARRVLKYEHTRDKFGKYVSDFVGEKKQGRVFAKDGEVLKIYVAKNISALYDDKKPEQLKKYIGVELEFCAPIKEQELALKLFRSGIHKFAQLKQDGSLRPIEEKKEVGYELALLLEEGNYKKQLKQVLTLLNSVGAVAQDRRAGLHVHLDMRKRNKDIVYNNFVACQYALLSIVDPKRYNNEFCRVVDSRKFPTEFSGERAERYKTINAAAFYKYKTLEIRMHEGSVDYVQISHWIDLLIKIANYSKKFKNEVPKLTILNKRISLNKKSFQYLIDRSCFWQVQNNEHTREMRNEINNLDENREIRARRAGADRTFDNQLNSLLRAQERIIPVASMPAEPTVTSGTTATVNSSGGSSWYVNPLSSLRYEPPSDTNPLFYNTEDEPQGEEENV